MKNKIIDIERSPFNHVYFLKLDCGHTVTRKRRPLSDFTDCEDCKLIAAQSKGSGAAHRPTAQTCQPEEPASTH